MTANSFKRGMHLELPTHRVSRSRSPTRRSTSSIDTLARSSVKLTQTYKRKSCSQIGSAPFTTMVVDLTFCSLSVT